MSTVSEAPSAAAGRYWSQCSCGVRREDTFSEIAEENADGLKSASAQDETGPNALLDVHGRPGASPTAVAGGLDEGETDEAPKAGGVQKADLSGQADGVQKRDSAEAPSRRGPAGRPSLSAAAIRAARARQEEDLATQAVPPAASCTAPAPLEAPLPGLQEAAVPPCALPEPPSTVVLVQEEGNGGGGREGSATSAPRQSPLARLRALLSAGPGARAVVAGAGDLGRTSTDGPPTAPAAGARPSRPEGAAAAAATPKRPKCGIRGVIGPLREVGLTTVVAGVSWVSLVVCAASTMIAMDKYKVELKNGTVTVGTVLLIAALMQVGHGLVTCVIHCVRSAAALAPQDRGCRASWRSLGFNFSEAWKHTLLGAMFAVAQLAFYSAINSSNATFAASVSICANTTSTVALRALIIGRFVTRLHLMILTTCLLVSVGFSGLQSSRSVGSDQLSNPAAAVGLLFVASSCRSCVAVFSELTFSRGAESPVKMANATHQTFNAFGAAIACAAWNCAQMSISEGSFHSAVWSPWSGPGLYLSLFRYVESLAALWTLEFCGSLPFVLMLPARLATVYAGKIIVMRAFFSIWEAFVCGAVVTSCALYLVASNVLSAESQSAVRAAMAKLEEKATQRGQVMVQQLRRASVAGRTSIRNSFSQAVVLSTTPGRRSSWHAGVAEVGQTPS